MAICNMKNCVEACECPPGFAEFDGNCVAIEQCPCYYKGQPYMRNETILNEERCSVW